MSDSDPKQKMLDLQLGHISENCATHSATLARHGAAIEDLKLWKANLEGKIFGFAAAGGLVGGLVPALLELLTRKP